MTWKVGTPVFNEKFGKGKISKINPYWNGTELYALNTHYKVLYSKSKCNITTFEKDLIKLEEK
jgi:hypothetical protein